MPTMVVGLDGFMVIIVVDMKILYPAVAQNHIPDLQVATTI